jgi:methylamine dehydrogenase heavy chain
MKRLLLILTLALAMLTVGTTRVLAQAAPEEGTRVAVLPPLGPHTVFVYSIASLGSFSPATVTIVDGDKAKILGMMTGGLGSGFAMPPGHRDFYMADTYYSRGSRGVRTDVLTIYDGKTLNPAGEVILPTKRQLTAQDNATTSVTPDGRFLVVANLTPATSATIVDLGQRKVAGEIDMTGCTEVLVIGPREFVSICGDGALTTTGFDDAGKETSRKRTAAPLFNPDKDPVWPLPAIVGHEGYFLSYHGMIYPADLAADPASPAEPWSIVTPEEKKANWRPGGIQNMAVDSRHGLIYVLMHQGGEWTHKEPTTHVWVIDLKTHKRVREITLVRIADAIMLTGDANPLLVAAMQTVPPATLGYLDFYSAADGKLLGHLGNFPVLATHLYALR